MIEAARRAGAAEAQLIEQPLAAAIGADLPINEPVGSMVVDIGGGTSESALLSMGGVVALEAVRVGSFDLDAAIQTYVRREHGIAIGERTAEEIKIVTGSAAYTDGEVQAQVRGRQLMTGLPETIVLSPADVRSAVEDRSPRLSTPCSHVWPKHRPNCHKTCSSPVSTWSAAAHCCAAFANA